MIGYVYVATTVLLTVYGQITLKWQVAKAGELPATASGKAHFLLRLLLNPWVISVFVAATVAAFSWIAAITRFELSRAYPFLATSFMLVVVLSAVFFDEALTAPKIIGVILVVAGLAVGSQT